MMENDYLWNKKGGDAEIEGLENLLAGFKYEPIVPPKLPAAVVIDEPTRFPWWKVSFAFAVPACLLFAIGSAFWLMRTGTTNTTLNTYNKITASSVASSTIDTEVVKSETKAAVPEITSTEEPKTVRTVFTERTRSSTPRAIRTKQLKAKKQPLDTLTAEEKFAYDQLKLALSITGSKLKVVSDTVNRTED